MSLALAFEQNVPSIPPAIKNPPKSSLRRPAQFSLPLRTPSGNITETVLDKGLIVRVGEKIVARVTYDDVGWVGIHLDAGSRRVYQDKNEAFETARRIARMLVAG